MTWCVARKCFQPLLNKVRKDHPLCLRQEMLSLALSPNFSKRFGRLRHEVHDFEAGFGGRFEKLISNLRSLNAFACPGQHEFFRPVQGLAERFSESHGKG